MSETEKRRNAWNCSPDGRRITFASSRQGTDIAVWVANADGTGPTQITHIRSPYSGSPRGSPDGRWLAFDARGKGSMPSCYPTEKKSKC